MKIPRAPHPWSLSPKVAAALQREMAASVRRERPRGPIRLVAGLDVAFSSDGEQCIGGVVVWDTEAGVAVEERVTRTALRFPYVPGLLSFREAPAVLAVLRKLRTVPDALMCDGHGLAHPRRFGLASHVGVIADMPTLGCAKSRLCGEHREPGRRRGSKVALEHHGEVIGSVLRTRDGVKPIYVSIGHRIDQATADRVALECGAGYRQPEPTRLADRLVAAAKRDA